MEAPRPLPGFRRLHVRDLARGLCIGALTLALLGTAAAPAGAAAGPGVQVEAPGGPLPFVPGSALKPGAPGFVEEERCPLRAVPGETPQVNGCRGVPVTTVLESLGIADFGYLTIARPNGTVAYLPKLDFFEYEGEAPPLFSVDDQSTHFYRPPRGAEDVNAEDNIATVSGEVLTVGVHQGNVVQVAVSASTGSTEAGSAVRFTATASGGLPGETFSYRWSFGDGSSAGASAEPVSHSFSGSGTYEVRASAVGSEESGGESGPADVVVGNPPAAAQAGATSEPPSHHPKAKPHGPSGKGRGGQGGGDGGKGNRSGRRHHAAQAHSDAGPARRSHSHTSEEAAEPATASPEAAPAPVTPAAEPADDDAAESKAAPTPTQGAGPGSSGEFVEGRLVGDYVGASALEEAVSGPADGQGSRTTAGAVDDGAVGLPVLALIVVALLIGGAAFEWRRSRPLS